MVVGQSDMEPTVNVLNSAGNLAFRINDDTHVGIGTPTPGARFMVVGGGNTDESAALNVVNADGELALHVRDNARVGIGTTSPGAKLMVVGTDGAPKSRRTIDGSRSK